MAGTTGTKKSSGHLAGQIQRNSVPEGSYGVNLYYLTAPKWSTDKADVNDTLTMEVACSGIDNGAKAVFTIYEKNSNCPDVEVNHVDAQVSGKKITAQWKYPQNRKLAAAASKWPVLPRFLFKCDCMGYTTRSGLLQLTTTLNITLLDENNKGVSNEPFDLFLSTKEIKSGTTDGGGKAKFQKIPLGCHQIKFSKNPLIAPDRPTKIESPLEIQKFPLDIFNDNKFFANSVVVRCSHKVDENYRFMINPPFFEVVQDPPKVHLVNKAGEEPEVISIYSDHKKTLNEKNGTTIKAEKESGFVKNVMECVFKGNPDSINILFPQFWKDLTTPTEYEVQNLRKTLPIKAYCPSEYKVSIKLPPLKKFDIGRKFASEGENVTLFDKSKTLGVSVPKKFHFTVEKSQGQWGKLKHPLAIGSTDKPITLEVNGKSIKISALDAFASVLVLVKKIGDIVSLITQSMPKAGWYATFDYRVMEGDLAFACKWKEYTDHQAFLHCALSLDFTLLSVAFEIGVGFSAFQVVGQVFIQLNGEVTLGFQGERISPTNPLELKIPFKAKIEGVGGARVKATVLLVIEFTISTGLEIADGEFKFFPVEGIYLRAVPKWSGVKGKISASAGVGKASGEKTKVGEQATAASGKKESVWVDGIDLGLWEWPKKETYQQNYLTAEEIKSVFKKVFKKDQDVVVATDIEHKAMSTDKVVDEIVSHFDEVPSLNRDARVVEGIAFDIKDRLSKLYSIDTPMGLFTPAVKNEQFYRFCREGGLKDLLEKAQDQTKILEEKLKND